MGIEKVNEALKKLKIRVKVEKHRGSAEHTDNIQYYQLNNMKMLVVFLDNGIIKSILRQKNIRNRYTYQINGQEGTNTECLYFANYDYDNHKYHDLLAE